MLVYGKRYVELERETRFRRSCRVWQGATDSDVCFLERSAAFEGAGIVEAGPKYPVDSTCNHILQRQVSVKNDGFTTSVGENIMQTSKIKDGACCVDNVVMIGAEEHHVFQNVAPAA